MTKFSGIIWNVGFGRRDDILNDVDRRFGLIRSAELDLRGGRYWNFLDDVYALEDMSKLGDKFEAKKEDMRLAGGERAALFDFEIDSPEYFLLERKNILVCRQAEDFKAELREKHAAAIGGGHRPDNVVHLSDSLKETLHMQKVWHRYRGCAQGEKSYPGRQKYNTIWSMVGSLRER